MHSGSDAGDVSGAPMGLATTGALVAMPTAGWPPLPALERVHQLGKKILGKTRTMPGDRK